MNVNRGRHNKKPKEMRNIYSRGTLSMEFFIPGKLGIAKNVTKTMREARFLETKTNLKSCLGAVGVYRASIQDS